MIKKEVTILNRLGMHGRAAAVFVTTASAFKADITVNRPPRTVSGKSIMGLMMLAAAKDTTITIHADGTDEKQAIDALVKLVADRFGEEE